MKPYRETKEGLTDSASEAVKIMEAVLFSGLGVVAFACIVAGIKAVFL